MKSISIKNIEKYHPGYRDRNLIWCKAYFTMINADPEFEMLCEIDKWRFLAMTMIQLQTKNPVPVDDDYLRRKGFDLKKRPIALTLKMLHNFIEYRNSDVTDLQQHPWPREYKEDKEKEKEEDKEVFPPSLDMVKLYCQERKNKISPQKFIDFYTSNGWMVGKNKMKDWRAAVRTWEGREHSGGKPVDNTPRGKPDPNCRICSGRGELYAPGSGKSNPCKCTEKKG